jgi:hypothetical protein
MLFVMLLHLLEWTVEKLSVVAVMTARRQALHVYVFTIHIILTIFFVFANAPTFHQLANIITFHHPVAIDKSYVFTVDLTFHQLATIDKFCSVQQFVMILVCLHSIDEAGAVYLKR